MNTSLGKRNAKQELHNAIRLAEAAFLLEDSSKYRSTKDWPKWLFHASKTLRALKKEEGTCDQD